jgi:hypothetical protein
MSVARFAAVLALPLAACTNPVQMYKAGATEAEYKRDQSICKDQASRAAKQQMRPREATQAHNRVLLDCMYSRGWEQRPPG